MYLIKKVVICSFPPPPPLHTPAANFSHLSYRS